MYRILGSDGKEYGPVSSEQLGQWIREKRVDGDTRVQGDDGQWRPLREVPELVALLQAPVVVPSLISESGESRSVPSDFDGDYDLDIGACLGAAWCTLRDRTNTFVLPTVVYLAIVAGLGFLGGLPNVGIVFSLGNLVIMGPLVGGLYQVYLRVIRGENPPWDSVFDGFRKAFGSLLLGQWVTTFLALLPLFPGIVALIAGVGAGLLKGAMTQSFTPDLASIGPGSVLLLIALPVALYLHVGWMFALPLILDQRLNFWSAMERSRRQVSRHWWPCFGLVVTVSILNVAGILVYFVGWLVTLPISMLMLVHAYETVIHGRKAP